MCVYDCVHVLARASPFPCSPIPAVGVDVVGVECVRPAPLRPADSAPSAFKAPLPSAAPAATPCTILTRLTLELTHFSHLSDLQRTNAALTSYDIIAVNPDSEKLFEAACESGLVDIIHVPCGSKLAFSYRRSHVRVRLSLPLPLRPLTRALFACVQIATAAKHGVMFEIAYGNALRGMYSSVLRGNVCVNVCV